MTEELVLPTGINDFLDRLGFDAVAPAATKRLPGRNDNWLVTTGSGRQVFVKRLVGNRDDVTRRIERIGVADAVISPAVATYPRCLGCDQEHALVAFTFLGDVESVRDLAKAGALDHRVSARMGRTVARLHAAPAGEMPGIDRSPRHVPPVRLLRGLPAEYYDECSAGALHAWHLMQRDTVLGEALTALHERSAGAERVPAHNDLRFDQFLVTGDDLYLTDWEEFGLGDPAYDIGGLVGEWLYWAVSDIQTGAGAESDTRLTHEEIIRRGTRGIDESRPVVAAFWAAYQAVRGRSSPALATRAAAFAGWHLIDRTIAAAMYQAKLGALQRAMAGIGRTILCDPGRFTATLGLGERS
jgi:aminoglycoside phosphotransferase (APT) family kinase protein